jgi:uncharacterized membrane protein YkoI
MRTGIIGGVAALLLVCTVVRADEEKVPLDKVPKAVLDAVKARFPDAKINHAATEKEDGKTVYELNITNKDQKIDVTLTPEGKITGMEKEIAAKDLPKAVSAALEKKYPKATYKKAEEVIKVSGKDEKLEYYEVLLVTDGKKTVEVEIAADGKILKEEEKKEKDEPKKDK